MMPTPIKILGSARLATALSALLACAGTLWVRAPARAQTAPAVLAAMDRGRFAIDVEFRLLLRAFESFTDEAAFRAFAASAASAEFGQRLKPLLAAPLAATWLKPLP